MNSSGSIPSERQDLHVLRPRGLQVKRDLAAALAEDLIPDLANVHARHHLPIDGVDDAVGLDASSSCCTANLDILDEDFSMRPARQVQAYAHGLPRRLGISGYRSSAEQRAAQRAAMIRAHSMLSCGAVSKKSARGVWSEGGGVAGQARKRARCAAHGVLCSFPPCGRATGQKTVGLSTSAAKEDSWARRCARAQPGRARVLG